MLRLIATTTKGDYKVICPENWEETSVDQFQRIVKDWDGEDWIQLFSILSGVEANDIETSTDHKLETALYQCIQFVFAKSELEDLPIPDEITLRPIWFSDSPLVCDVVKIPRKIGRLTIGQAIQARKLLEETRDIREAISSVTAIYFQPLIDKAPFDMMRAIEIEQVILKMPITKIYPIGFFLLRRLNESGQRRNSVWHLIKNWVRLKRGKR